jgi:hypothetical protein|nr:conserved hypothetical protein [uncultured bacterium]|tara:strand:- start:304 stop:1125 length:822 start_codon:yes stop_codon:yes gene_type:complete
MYKKKLFLLLVIAFLLFANFGFAQNNLPRTSVFKVGEKINYKVLYNWGFIWVNAAEVEFKIDSVIYESQTAFQFKSTGKTLEKWDWMYKVRDTYLSITDTSPKLNPFYFERNVKEGKTRINNSYVFDKKTGKVNCTILSGNSKPKKIALVYEEGIFDVMTMIYQARLLPYDDYKVKQEIPIKLILDAKVHSTYVKYLGTETIVVDEKGEIECYKFKPKLIEGSIFSAGEEMIVWVSKDKNRAPIMVETSILVGSIRAIIKDWEGLVSELMFLE